MTVERIKGLWPVFAYARLKRPGYEDNASMMGDLRRMPDGDHAAHFGTPRIRIWGQVIYVDDVVLERMDHWEDDDPPRFERVELVTVGGMPVYAYQYAAKDFQKLPKIDSTWSPYAR